MKNVSGKELCKILKKHGWELKNIKSNYHVYMKNKRKERISIPVHSDKVLKSLLKAILKLTDIEIKR